MGLISLPVPNLLGGISQQPPANRQPGQLEDAENVLLHVVNGLGKRKGSRHVARLFTGDEYAGRVHYIDRDAEERYIVLMGERRLRVFDEDGAEYPVYNTSNQLLARAGRTIPYLNPRVVGGEPASSEDFAIVALNWLSTVGNSTTSYVSGRGPFGFGRFEASTTTTADTVAQVGNGAAASVSDIYQAISTFALKNVAAVFAKKSSSAINDFELGLIDTTAALDHTARFDISPTGVITVGAVSGAPVEAFVEDYGDGWYLCWIRVTAFASAPPAGYSTRGNARRYRIRFHTNAATPENKNLLLFGARYYSQAEPNPYVHDDVYRALTIADTTLLLNRETVPAMTTDATPAIDNKAFVWVRQGGQGDCTYTVRVHIATLGLDSTVNFTTTTAASGLTTRSDEGVAEALRAAIDAHADLVATRRGSVIRIVHAAPNLTPPSEVTDITVTDSRGDQAMVAIRPRGPDAPFPTISKFTDLPLIMDENHVVRVTGNPEREVDDYWVKFRSTDTGSLVPGYWEESLKPAVSLEQNPFDDGIPFRIDNTTMPQQLVRKQDDAAGTVTGNPLSIYFQAGPVTWDDRLVGDVDSNPDPVFIGNRIRDMFLHRGRLGFVASDTVVLSELNEIFNFWRSTVLEVPDTDPIEVASGAREVTELQHGISGLDTALIFSDRHQFELLGDPTLTPATAQLQLVRSFAGLTETSPVTTGRGILFVQQTGDFAGLLESTLLGDATSIRLEELTVQAPRILEAPVGAMAYSSLVGITAAVGADPSTVLVHHTFYDDTERRLQSALVRWTFGDDAAVRGVGFFDAELFLVVERAEGWFLEAVDCSTTTTDDAGRPLVLLDRRVDQDQVTATYDGPNNETDIVLPYNIPASSTVQVVDAESGLIVPITAQTTTTVTVTGNFSAADLYVGEVYTMRVGMTEPVIQQEGARGIVPVMGRPVDLHLLHVYLAGTAYLRCRVERDLRGATTEEFSAAGLGTGLLSMGTLNTYTGDTSFAIIGASTEVAVTLENDTPFPSFVQSARWEALANPRA